MRLIYAGIVFACATLGFADTITLKNGRVINGTYLGGTARTLRVDDGRAVQTLDIFDVVRIEFGGGVPPTNGIRACSAIMTTVRRCAAPMRSAAIDAQDDDRPVLRPHRRAT